LRIEGAGALLLASESTNGGAGASFSSQRAALRAGYLPFALGDATVGPSAGVAVDHVSASGFGGGQAFTPGATFLSASAGALGVWAPTAAIRQLAVRLLTEAVIPFDRPSFVVREPAPAPPTVLHRTPAVAGRATLGVEVHFP
jgi:hypothetical protein